MKNLDFGLRTPDSELQTSDPRPRTLDARLRLHGGDVYAFARARSIVPEQVLDFSASINPLGYPPSAASAYRRALSRIIHYPEPYAETPTTALAAYHGLDPRAVLASSGSTQLIYLLARALAARRVLLIAPLFSEHEAAFRLSGAQVERFFLRPPTFTLSLEYLGKSLAKNYDVLVLTNPNSPTGALVSRVQVEELARICRRANTRVVVDETFVDWVEEESIKQVAVRSSNVIVLRSLTKFFAVPGLRVGYLIAQPQLVRQLRSRIEPWSVNTVAQEVVLACVQDQQFAQRSRVFMVRERAWLFDQLTALSGLQPFPSRANFLLVRIRTNGLDATELVQRLAGDNLLVRDCRNFSGLGKRFFRVAVRTRLENRRLLTGLQSVLGER